MMIVVLGFQFVAGNDDLVGVDDNNIVSTINIRGVLWFVLALRTDATTDDKRPNVLPVPSTTYHVRLTSAGFNIVV